MDDTTLSQAMATLLVDDGDGLAIGAALDRVSTVASEEVRAELDGSEHNDLPWAREA